MLGSLTAGCGHKPTGGVQHPEWVIRSRVEFLSERLEPLPPWPLSAFRLSFSYIAGDLYGSPTTGDFIQPVLQPDYSFEVDLNRSHEDLLRSLQPTDFGLEYLKIAPSEARIARLAPLALQPDGIEQVATADWVDPGSGERLMLVYADRPARITGSLHRNGHTVRYDVRAGMAGYVWIAGRDRGPEERVYTEVDRPESVILALTPLARTPRLRPR